MRNSGRGGREAFKNRLRRSCNKIPLKWDREEMLSRNKWKRKLLKREGKDGRKLNYTRSPFPLPCFYFLQAKLSLFFSLLFPRKHTFRVRNRGREADLLSLAFSLSLLRFFQLTLSSTRAPSICQLRGRERGKKNYCGVSLEGDLTSEHRKSILHKIKYAWHKHLK